MVYDKQEVGMRLRMRRKEMRVTGEEIGRRIGKNSRYYRDIENGKCGMSIETLILLSSVMGLSLDYLIYGISADGGDEKLEEQKAVSRLLSRCSGKARKGAVNLLKIYLEALSET